MTTTTTKPTHNILGEEEARPLTQMEHIHLLLGQQYFWYFLDNVFIRSFDGMTFTHPETNERLPFKFARIHREWAMLAQMNPRLTIMAPRGHLKTTVLGQAYPLWLMCNAPEGSYYDGIYFSYKADLANERVADLKRYIKGNPFFRFWKDLKPNAESVIDYLVDWGDGPVCEVTLKGSGIMSATRGRHPKFVICDDILSDFTNPLTSSDLRLINRIFRQTIMPLPSNPDDPLMLVGTPQAYDDILYQLAQSDEWLWLLYPAIKDFITQEVQWPEKYSFERLTRLRSSSGVGKTAFEIEYQLVPVTVMDQFLTIEDVMGVVDAKMKMWSLTKPFPNEAKLAVYGGVDVGKKVHPSHVCVMLELPSGTLVMLYEGFLDHMSYPRQVRLLNVLAKTFGITRAYYDATFNVMEDRGLDRRWRGRAFTKKLKANLATGLEKRVFAEIDEPGIILTGDPRFLNQICQVRKDLQAAETPEGHGDAFWSLALACQAAADGPTLVEIGSANPPRLQSPVIHRTGNQQATRIGQGWQDQLSNARR